MKLDSRLSGVLHLLLHMLETQAPVTSEQLASYMQTNPVVVRRTMAGLRNGGLVRSEKGHGGGWMLACDPDRTTLLQIYTALGSPSLFAIGHRSAAPSCLIEQAVNAALEEALQEASVILMKRLDSLTLATLALDVSARGQIGFPQVRSAR